MAAKRKQLTLRVTPDAYALISDAANRLGIGVSTYVIGRALADAAERSAGDAVLDRIDALEHAVADAVNAQQERIESSLAALEPRVAAAVSKATDQLYARVNADLHGLNKSLGAVVLKASRQPAAEPAAVANKE